MKQPFVLYFLVLIFSQSISAQKKIVASASIFQDMAQQIVGDVFEVESIVPIGGDPHLHEPTPRDAQLVTQADLIIINGLTFEGWINELIQNSGSKAAIALITEGVNPLSSTEYANSSDPHAWMDVSNGLKYIENIWKALIELSPEHATTFTTNYKSYKQKLEDLDQYITDQIRKVPLNQRVLITSHDAFAYYGQRYGIRVEALVGISTEAQAKTNDMIRVNKVIKENKIPAIFVESTIDPKLIKQIAKDNNVTIGGELFADSIGDENSEAHGYWEMLKHNTDTIVKALMNENPQDSSASHTHENEQSSLWLYLLAGILLLGGLLLAIFKINK